MARNVNEDLGKILRLTGVSREAYEAQTRALASRSKAAPDVDKVVKLAGIAREAYDAQQSAAVPRRVHLASSPAGSARRVHHGPYIPLW